MTIAILIAIGFLIRINQTLLGKAEPDHSFSCRLGAAFSGRL